MEGPDSPLYADFHTLRHSYLTLGDRAGIDLRTLQELAGHSTTVLMARYSHLRLYDLAGAVEKLPRLLPDEPQTEVLRATGTDPVCTPVCTGFVQTSDPKGDCLRQDESGTQGQEEKRTGLNPLQSNGVEASCDSVRLFETRVSEGTRTPDILIHSQVL